MREDSGTSIFQLHKDVLVKILLLSILSAEDVAQFSAACKFLRTLVQSNALLLEKINLVKKSKAVHVLATDSATFLWKNFRGHCVLAEVGKYSYFKRIPLPESLISITQVIAANKQLGPHFILGVDANRAPVLLRRTSVKDNFEALRLPSEFTTVIEMPPFSEPSYLVGKDSNGRPFLAADKFRSFEALKLLPKAHNIVQVSVSHSEYSTEKHSLVHAKDIFENSLIFSSGNNRSGQLGMGDYEDRLGFHPVLLPEKFVSVTHILARPNFSVICGVAFDGTPLFSHCGSMYFNSDRNSNIFTIEELPGEISKIQQVEYTLSRCYLYALNFENQALFFHVDCLNVENVFKKIEIPEYFTKIPKFVALPKRAFFYREDFGENLQVAILGHRYFEAPEKSGSKADYRDYIQLVSLPKEFRSLVYVGSGLNHVVISGINANGLPVLAALGHNNQGQMGVGSLGQEIRSFKLISLPSFFQVRKEIKKEEVPQEKSSHCTLC